MLYTFPNTAYLFINPGLNTIRLVEEFVEREGINEALFAQLGQIQQVLVALVDAGQATLHVGRLTILHTANTGQVPGSSFGHRACAQANLVAAVLARPYSHKR